MQIDNLPEFEAIDLELPIEETSKENDINSDVSVEKTDEEDVKYAETADSTAIAFYKELKERGYVVETENDKFDGTWEKLDEYLETFPQKVLDQVVQSLPDVSKDILRYIATAGENITKEELKNFFVTYFEDSNEISVETMDDARNYLKDYYSKELKLKEKVINTMLDQLEEDEELLEEAKAILQKQTENKKTEKLIQSKEEENIKTKQAMQEKISAIKNELQSTQWKPERIQKVQNVLSGKNLSDTLSEVINNPKSLVQLADILTYYDSKTKSINLDHFTKQASTQVVKSIKDRIEREMSGSATLKTNNTRKDSQDTFDNLIPVVD